MSEPIFVFNKKIFDNQSMASDLSSEVIDVAELLGFAIHLIWTGVPDGDISLEASNDGTNFVSFNTVTTGATFGQNMVNVEQQHYRYFRATYTATSGTGNLTGYIAGKRH